MPIRFRCPHCERLLGIARRKAGTPIRCPQCGEGVTVPHQDEAPDRTLRDLDDLLGPVPGANGSMPQPAPEPAESVLITQDVATMAPPRMPASKPTPKRQSYGEEPLFERADMEELLGLSKLDGSLPRDEGRSAKVKPVSGTDALSLDDGPKQIVLTSQRATLLVVAAAVLIVLAFAAGFLIRSSV